MEQLRRELGIHPDLDLATKLFCPPIPHEEVPKADEDYKVFRIKVDGIVIRYVADMYSIQMTAEGDLLEAYVQALASDLVVKMSALENTPCESKQL